MPARFYFKTAFLENRLTVSFLLTPFAMSQRVAHVFENP
jgi:hypothetical protein